MSEDDWLILGFLGGLPPRGKRKTEVQLDE